MGSQWPGMASALMKLEPFRNGIQKCADALKPHGVDLIDVVTTTDESKYVNHYYIFVFNLHINY